MWVLSPTLRRNVGNGPLEDLEERLLHPLPRHVASDRRVLRLARDLVDLVDVDDPALRALDVAIGRLDQAQQNVLDILSNVASLSKARCVGDTEGNVEEACKCLRQERLPGSGGANKQYVRLRNLNAVL